MPLANVALLLEDDAKRHAHAQPEGHLALDHADHDAEHLDLLAAADPDGAPDPVAHRPRLGVGGAVPEALLASVGAARFVLGTGQPLRLPENAGAKLDLLDLSSAERTAIESGNALALRGP